MSLQETWTRHITSLRAAVTKTYEFGLRQGMLHSEVIDQILNLAGSNWREAKKFIPPVVYPRTDARFGCQTDDYGIAVDPISLRDTSGPIALFPTRR